MARGGRGKAMPSSASRFSIDPVIRRAQRILLGDATGPAAWAANLGRQICARFAPPFAASLVAGARPQRPCGTTRNGGTEEETGMIRNRLAALAALALLAASPARGEEGPVKIVSLMELTGTGTTAGTNFSNGVNLAFKEINAAGGI